MPILCYRERHLGVDGVPASTLRARPKHCSPSNGIQPEERWCGELQLRYQVDLARTLSLIKLAILSGGVSACVRRILSWARTRSPRCARTTYLHSAAPPIAAAAAASPSPAI